MHASARVFTTAALVAFPMLAMAACGRSAPSGQAEAEGDTVEAKASSPDRYVDITPEQLRTMMASKDFVLINVHTPHAGDIEGTDLSIPYNEIGPRTGEIPGDKDAPIVLYCRSGHMSAQAAKTLVSLGYTSVYNLVGGMQAWEGAGP